MKVTVVTQALEEVEPLTPEDIEEGVIPPEPQPLPVETQYD